MNHLSWIKGKKFLYLAKFAPGTKCGHLSRNQLCYSEAYHLEISELLEKLDISVINARDPSLLFDKKIDYDFVFSLYNRIPCSNGEVFVSAVCEYKNVPYLGAKPHMRAIAEDKHLSKIIALRCGLNTPDWILGKNILQRPAFDGPYFVKPRFGAASEFIDGDSIQYTWEGAVKRVAKLENEGVEALVEHFIDGINLTVPVLEKPLTPIKIPSTTKYGIITVDEKFSLNQDDHYEVCSENVACSLKEKSEAFINYIDQVDYTRIDFRYDEDTDTAYFLEFNLCCDISSKGSFVFSAKSIGMKHLDLILKILERSFRRNKIL